MSYDIVVFDPAQAPSGSSDFLEWYQRQAKECIDPIDITCAGLKSFFSLLSNEYPDINNHEAINGIDNPKLTQYFFGLHSIYMSFTWSQAEEAHRDVTKFAVQSSVGFYDISDSKGFIWRPPIPGQFGVFYCFYATGEEVTSDLPVSLNLEKVTSRLLPKLESDSDFIGIVDANGKTVQFMFHRADNCIWMEIPSPEKRGSYGKYILPFELHDEIKNLPSEFSVSRFPEMKFQSWDAQPPKKKWWKFW